MADQSFLDPDHLDRLIPEAEAADFLGYSVRALQNWRLRGGGPVFVRVSCRSIRYRRRRAPTLDARMLVHSWAGIRCRAKRNRATPQDPEGGPCNTPL